jgi:DNA repair exonuclease SbcCD nuclease subunit/predicted nuclease with TOPRIM domain
MKPITIFHTADIHTPDARLHPEWNRKAIASLTTLAETAEARKPDLVVIAGDLYHGGIQNSAAAGFPAFIAVIRRILNVCPIAAVSGTTTHDPAGAYRALTTLKAGHPFILLDPAEMSPPVAWLCEDGTVAVEIYSQEDPVGGGTNAKLMILGCPEPTREWILAGMEGAETADMAGALKDAMKRLLLGYGAIRAQYPDVPCVFLYHGAVDGASMQNGQVVGASEITIGREDLSLVGADYYALGHIHVAQQIGELPAYYAGNAYPKEWGELGTSGFNLVTIAKNNAGPGSGWGGIPFVADIHRINYPHPRRVKFSLDWPEPAGPEVEGVQAWVAYRATEEQAEKIDTAALLEAYIEQGALPGSRVTVDVIRTETVRAAEITEKKSLRDKVKVKAEADGAAEPAESVLLKSEQLEREAEQMGYGGTSHHLRLKKVRVRGHYAHVKRLGVDEVTLDLSKFGPGLIALTGPNGYGKTSLGENAHWFPCEWSPGRDRKGGLKDSFCLRDSLREVWKDDPRTGEEYRSLIEIDGKNASGKVKCHLFRRAPGGEWQPLGNDSMASYLDEVTKLEGSPRMFLRSAFWAQEPSDNNPRIRRATEGEKKELFAELAISVPYKVYAANTKAKADAIDGEISKERDQIALLEGQLAELPDMVKERETKTEDLRTRNLRLASIESDGKAAAKKVDDLAKALQAQKIAETEVSGLKAENVKRAGVIADANEQVAGYAKAVERKVAAEKIIEAHGILTKEEGAEHERISGIRKERERLTTEYGREQATHSDTCQQLESQKSGLRTEIARLEGDREVIRARIDHLKLETRKPINPECPECGQRAHADTCSSIAKLTAEKAQNDNFLADSEAKFDEFSDKIQEKEVLIEGIIIPDSPPPPILPSVDEQALQRIRGQIQALKVEEAREVLQAAQEAAARTEELRKQIQTAEAEIRKVEDRILKLEATFEAALEGKHQQASAEYEDLRRKYGDARVEAAKVKEQLVALETRVKDLEKQGADIKERKATLDTKAADLSEWRYLEKACGPDGIPALELDALGPSIAAEANKLLGVLKNYEVDNHYDQIKFETTRIAGKGKDTHQIEDFTIWCHDTKLGLSDDMQWVDFAKISVGEAVWVDTALMEAFAIIRERNSGKRSLTQWRDEGDSALDAESRRAYFALLNAAQEASGRYQTIITSHSPEALEMIEQRIDIRDLAKKENQV